ncbi:MAG: hypothetical protein ACJ8G3_25015 [Burkholderiaceae bacterium]
MKSSLVPGMAVSVYDLVLKAVIGFDKQEAMGQQSRFLLGIRNEIGQIYRLVAIDDLKTLLSVLNRVYCLNCVVEKMQENNGSDMTAIIKLPKHHG